MVQIPVNGLLYPQKMVKRPQHVYVKSILLRQSCGYVTKPMINWLDISLPNMIRNVGGGSGNDIVSLNHFPMGWIGPWGSWSLSEMLFLSFWNGLF